MKEVGKLVAGLDLNGVWDHCAHIRSEDGEEVTCRHEDLGARSVVVRARRCDGDSILVGGREALESIYGRGEKEFGEVGRTVRRIEIGEAWRRIRGEYEVERASILKQDAGEEEEITPNEALLAQARAAIGRVSEGRAQIRNAGIVMRDDEASTETVQDEVRTILGWNALGGTRSFLVWDSVAVAKAALKHCPEVRAGEEIALVMSYGKRIRIYRLGIRQEEDRRVPERRRAEERSGRSRADGEDEQGSAWAEGWDIWHEGWEASLENLRASADRTIRAVIRQTRQAEEWALDKHGKTVVRVKEDDRTQWTVAKRPWTPVIRAREEPKIDLGEKWSKVVVWTPMGHRATEALASCIGGPQDRITKAHTSWAAEGAALAALDLELGQVPWYDQLDRMVLKVERDGEPEELVLVDEKESVPAGTAYRTSDQRAREISENVYMSGGQDAIKLPFTKGSGERKWSQIKEIPLPRKPKGRANIELRARQTPGQGSAEIELRSPQYGPWRDAAQIVRFSRNTPDKDAVKPALIRYEPAKKAWDFGNGTEELILAAEAIEGGGIGPSPKQFIAIRNWLRTPSGEAPLNKEHTVGTDGQIPDSATSGARQALEKVLEWTERKLLEAIKNGTSQKKKQGALNALHLIHTWCFAKASPNVVEALIQATEGVVKNQIGLQWEADGARRAIWQGLGRSVTTRDTIERVLDGALRTAKREEIGTMTCDALAAASHLLARRHIAAELVFEDGRRVKKAAAIACGKMHDMSKRIRERPEDRFTMKPGLQLRYAVLLAGGLARVKDMKAEGLQHGTKTARELAGALDSAIRTIDGNRGWNAQGAKGLKPIMEGLRDLFGTDKQPDTNLLKLLDA